MQNSIIISAGKPVAMRLYAIHHAGGSHMLYRPWASLLPEWIELIALEIPGRGLSFGAPFCQTMEDAIELLLSEIQTDTPFALFGHSMGALIAYELTLRLQRQHTPPAWLGLSAFLPPHVKNQTALSRYSWGNNQLMDYLFTLGGIANLDEFTAEPAVMNMLLDILRSDFSLIDNWRMSDELITENIQAHCFSSREDPVAGHQLMSDWQKYISSSFSHTVFSGGHFYLAKHVEALLDIIVMELHALR
ncbi:MULTISPECIES: thioesterase II family protein [Pectobacterium]|uniref:Thioesterase n=1 Tax=Pectobacterium odoriferum TaxID=78398 RepID=A0ABD6VJH3_9GAMM|nr:MULTISPECIES: alpha/beta fold hydrolase [Pectobacterium]AIU89020.1 hypothetical protein BCS7_13570 [Pectobacterium odoriferum]KGA31083.1 hypothetical protein KS43_19790 [Pectobacterium odoriferum]KGA39753.1 hypothetical protein KU75_20880 [Pectobacterium odoriferum]MBA0187150.1 thioesterase [Pectobacterium odoriferum]MCA6962977.1 alpha/beta fold hydrolase [Pectobacterium odoriferum]